MRDEEEKKKKKKKAEEATGEARDGLDFLLFFLSFSLVHRSVLDLLRAPERLYWTYVSPGRRCIHH